MRATSPPILIAGFHRSGTSAVARGFHNAGLDLGDELLGAEAANPYGHFEDTRVIEAHDDALARAGLTWKSPVPANASNDKRLRTDIDRIIQDRNTSEKPWGIKDPRLCLFLGQWLAASPSANVIVVFRRPADAIASLHRRHARRLVDTRGKDPSDRAFWEQPDLALELWNHYYEQLLAQLPDLGQVFAVDFSDRACIERLPELAAARWHLPLTLDEPLRLDPDLGVSTKAVREVRDLSLMDRTRHTWERLSAISSKEVRNSRIPPQGRRFLNR